MINPDLHIVSFAVPFPARYGGAIDVYNRVKALHQEGVKVALHCFIYGVFNPHSALKEVTHEVHYYPRITWPALLSPGLPYIVSSRRNPMLYDKLEADNAPVLFEGIHTTGFCNDLKGRKKLLRAHNIEHQYYDHLAKISQRFHYLFFQRESLALEHYECNHACSFDTVFAISKSDNSWYEKKGANSQFLPVFHGIEETDITFGKGEYILYQGDLSIELNQKAVLDLVNNLQEISDFPIIIAGKSGDRFFEEKLTQYPNLKREVDVSDTRMHDLIKGAQVIIIHSLNPAGMKVKIFPALYHGRFVVANENSITYTDLDKSIHIYKNYGELRTILKHLRGREFTLEDLNQRKVSLSTFPSDSDKARQIIQHI